MNTPRVDENHGNGIRYMGVDWRGTPSPPPIKPNDSLLFCDLRDCILDELDLSMVEFLGCRLNGTSFQGATLRETQFIGCFSSHHFSPTDFRSSLWDDVVVVDSHLHYLSDQSLSAIWYWSPEVAQAASGTLSERSDVRYDAAVRLGTLGDPVAAPVLACLLADNEWEVRLVSLKALGQLYHKRFPQRGEVLLEWMFLCLGDKHSIVRQTVGQLVVTLSPPDKVLLVSIGRMMAHSSEEQLAGLRAAVELCRLDDDYSRLVDLEMVKSLLLSEVSEVRSESLHLLGILDDPSTTPWILAGLSDPASTVRVAALSAIKLLSEPPPPNNVTPLLNDPDEDVRIEAIYALGQIGNFDPQDVELALSDPSAEVRRLAQKLLEGK
jgi:HEAT repeats/Pentapeptide repeats (8 copies)/HEAT repeat